MVLPATEPPRAAHRLDFVEAGAPRRGDARLVLGEFESVRPEARRRAQLTHASPGASVCNARAWTPAANSSANRS
jgi:hypothetical protein